VIEEIAKDVVVADVVVDRVILLKMFAPLNVLLSTRSVDEAVLSVAQPKRPADHCRKEPELHVVRFAPWRLPVKSFDEEAVVLKKLVVVADVPVALVKVKFWRVVEPTERIFEDVNSPESVVFPPLAVVKNRLVDEAVVENRFVVVADVPVALVKVKFWRVVEPRAFSVPDGKMKLPVPNVPPVIVEAD